MKLLKGRIFKKLLVPHSFQDKNAAEIGFKLDNFWHKKAGQTYRRCPAK